MGIENILASLVTDFKTKSSFSYLLVLISENEELYSHVIDEADTRFLKYMNGEFITEDDKIIILAGLTLVCLNDYDEDGNFLAPLKKSFCKSKNVTRGYAIFDSRFRDITRPFRNGFSVLPSNIATGIGVILAGITKHWLPSFFDFCFEVYKHNLFSADCDDETVIEEFTSIFLLMKKYLNGKVSSDEFSFGKKTYKLSKYTLYYIISNPDINYLALIGLSCVKLISAHCNLEDIEISPFYQSAFESWMSSYDKRNEKRGRPNITKSRKPRLFFLNRDAGPFLLNTGISKIPDECTDENDLYISVIDRNGNELERSPLKIIDNDAVGGNIVDEVRFPFDSPFILDKCQIIYSGECIQEFSIKRDVAIFKYNVELNDNGLFEEIKLGTSYNGQAIVFVHDKSVVNKELSVWKNGVKYFVLDTKNGSSFVVDGESYSFFDKMDSGVIGDLIESTIGVVLGREVGVFRSVNSVVFDTQYQSGIYQLLLDGKPFQAEPTSYLNFGSKQILFPLNDISRGYHELSLVRKDNLENPLKKACFILDSDFFISLRENKHFLSTSFECINVDEKNGEPFVNFQIKVNHFFGFSYRTRNMVKAISLNGYNWKAFPKYIGFEDLENLNYRIYLTGYILPALKIVIDGENILPRLQTDLKNKFYFDVRTLVSFKHKNFVTITVSEKNDILGRDSTSFIVNYVPVIEDGDLSIKYDKTCGIHKITLNAKSTKKLYLKITDSRDEIVFKNEISSNNTIICESLKPFEKYRLSVILKKFISEREIFSQDYFYFGMNVDRYELPIKATSFSCVKKSTIIDKPYVDCLLNKNDLSVSILDSSEEKAFCRFKFRNADKYYTIELHCSVAFENKDGDWQLVFSLIDRLFYKAYTRIFYAKFDDSMYEVVKINFKVD